MRLSSANPKDIFSASAPISDAIIPIKYSVTKFSTLGVKKTTIVALIKNAAVPSRLLKMNLCLPNFLPIIAAKESLIIRIEKAVMKIILGKISTQINAEMKT